ncbi:YqaA family protein [Asticcacaulis endophyticus]|uniref:Cytochrome b561 n=1 Tax=Asticcacaulis endophyticus TaxID=1395890 RepID=A0A918Q2R0_9CAUL|nr:YqaA family protein [Asticcacaulis endophyticus]GGZ30382.1 cytochrome b561 [Asticcacaulis endophyticus]
MLRPIYNWMINLAGSRHAEKALAVVSFAESSFFPIPPDVMLAPMALARPDKAYRYAIVCTIASVFGAMLGYAIGYYLEPVGIWLLKLFGYSDDLSKFHDFMAQWGPWVIIAKGLTPIPFKLVTIAAGLGHMNLGIFIASCIITRTPRFLLVAYLLKKFGPEITHLIEKRIYTVSAIALAVLVLLIVAIKMIPH